MTAGFYKQLRNGSKATVTAGTRVALTASKTLVRGLRITAKPANTGLIYLGDSAVAASNGYLLDAGDTADLAGMAGGEDAVFDLSKLYIDSSVNAEGVTFAYLEDAAL